MAATRQPATKALPFGARFWAKLLRKVSPNDARKYRLWALLGWRRAQFQRVEFVEVANEGGISIRTPPGKGKHLNLPTTVVKCRCEMYATSYKLLQPAGDRFVCAACSTPMPTWETNVAMADIEADGYGGHSFRRTLAICIKLCLLEYNITRTERLAKRINTRLQWFDGTALDEPIPASNFTTLDYYSSDSTEFNWKFFPPIFRQAAMEICFEPGMKLIAAPNGESMLM